MTGPTWAWAASHQNKNWPWPLSFYFYRLLKKGGLPTDGFHYENFWARPIHPRIKEAIDNAKSLAEAKTTVFDACVHIVKQSGWGHQQEAIMRSASVKDFDATIRSLEPDDLRLFMCRFLEMCVQPGNYEKHFGSAMENFVQACREICADPAGGRLATLIQLLFKDAKLELVSDAMTDHV